MFHPSTIKRDMLLSHNEPIHLACIIKKKNMLLLDWFGWQISECVSQLFRSQCVKVTSYCSSLRSVGQAWLVWSFQSPVRESLESCSSRNCRASLVYRAIQQWLWNKAGPSKYIRWKQDREEEGESRRELGAALLISTIPEVKGRGRVGLPLVMSSNHSHLWRGP